MSDLLSDSQRELFWNAFRNLQKGIETTTGYDFDRENLTYIQADDRYLRYLDDYLAATPGISDEDKTRIRGEAQAAYTQSNATLNDPNYAYSTTMTAMANDFYFAIETNNRAMLGGLANPPVAVAAIPPDSSAMATDAVTPSIIPSPVEGLTVTPILPEDFRYVPPVAAAELAPEVEADITTGAVVAVPTTRALPPETAIVAEDADVTIVAALPPTDRVTAVPEDATDTEEREPLRIDVTNPTIIQWPIAGTLVGTFGQEINGKPSDGVKIAAAEGTPVRSTADGMVIHVGENEELGNFMIVEHNDRHFAVYGHLRDVGVQVGDTVTRDQAIATVGRTGDVTSPQLHFELRIGNDRGPVDPVVELGGPPAAPPTRQYTVEADDNLWKIARREYGLTSDADIARAVEHIAAANNMSEGTNANRIVPGQVLQIPPRGDVTTPSASPLNWAALDRETRTGQIARGDFRSIEGSQPIRFQADATAMEKTYMIGRGGNLSRTVFEAARQEGITLDRSRINTILERVAQENGTTPDAIVQPGQQFRISRDMLTPAVS